jgi:alkanesulfonate monooxygenase SsuD/methylene tetrahydromethanopterin reductase-like flavin-dependent oxidoreductase (luciferase family)
MGLLDPLPLIAIVSRVTSRLGLGVTVATSFERAFQLARSLATLDTLSRAVSHGTSSPCRARPRLAISASRIISTATRATIAPTKSWRRASHCRGELGGWRTRSGQADWPFADPSKVHYVNAGEWERAHGPLTAPRSPQGRPVLMQAGSSPRGREFAARWAEIIFTLQHAKSDMQEFCNDMAKRMSR